jgi:SAM-dependent methyltransferase
MFTLSPSGLLNKDHTDLTGFRETDPTFVSRYLLQAGILEAYQLHQGIEKLKVLDVGGAGSILKQFIDVDLTIIDVLPNTAKVSNYIQGSALAMPFADNQFDAVISCDVLEHIPKDDRAAFLSESARVTKDLMIVAAPFNLKGVREAEIAANDYYKKMTGEDHRWLFEHLLDELPNLQHAHQVLDRADLHTSHFSHTALDNWQLVTRAGFLLAQQNKHPKFTEVIEEFNQYYLSNIMPCDFSANGYRSFLIASKQHEVDIKPEPDVYKPELQAIFTLLTDAMLKLL